MNLNERILLLFSEHPEKSKSELARFAKVSRTTPTDWTSGKTKVISWDNAQAVALFFGNINPEWVYSGVGNKYLPVKKLDNNVTSTAIKTGCVPLISNVQAGVWMEAIDQYEVGDSECMVETTVPVGKHTFALRVSGDSMQPEFMDGDIIIVEPELSPANGDYVIAKNGGDATFKKLVKDGSDWYLKPLNSEYKQKPLGDSKIIGVVREKPSVTDKIFLHL